MNQSAPHYLLITEAKTVQTPYERSGKWRFVLEQMGFEARVEVADVEPDVVGERLELLVVVRGLEALEQPSRVTLITSSRYVGRGIRRWMRQWKANDWRWERFGTMSPVRHNDLWRRVDQAMSIHRVDCRLWNFSQQPAGQPELPERENYPRRRNVIRPHGELSGTARKPLGTPEFGDPNRQCVSDIRPLRCAETSLPTARSIRRTVMPNMPSSRRFSFTETVGCRGIVDNAGPTASVVSIPLTHPKINDSLKRTTTPVRPHRAGRAYGYAPN